MPKRERIYRTEGVILRRQDLGETDRLTTIYTREFGKLRLVAKGVRRPGSRKSGHLEPFTRAALLVARGRELDIITQAEALEDFSQIQTDLHRLGQASYIAELIDRFSVEEGEGNTTLYQLLLRSLQRLTNPELNSSSVILHFQLRLLDIAGYRPDFFHCVHCEHEIKPENQFYSFQFGGVVCQESASGLGDLQALGLGALKVLRFYQKKSFSHASKPGVPEPVFVEIRDLMDGYLTYILERRLNSPAFLRRVEHLDLKNEEA
jgi:DNA repair protein RecO (recombination protein O)